MIDTLVQWLIDWGYPGLFLSAFLAGSLIPFSSEIVLLTLVKLGLNPMVCLVLAMLGNTYIILLVSINFPAVIR